MSERDTTQPGEDATAPTTSGAAASRHAQRFFGEAALWTATWVASAALVTGAFALLAPSGPLLRPVAAAGALATVLVVAALLVRHELWGERGHAVVVTVYTGVLFAALLLLFRGGDHGLNAEGGDAAFMTAQFVKAQAYLWPTDYYLQGASPFYPPLYPLVAGKLAGALGFDGIAARQLGAIAVVALVPALTFIAWRPMVGSSSALIITIAASAGLEGGLWKPHEHITLWLFGAWVCWLEQRESRQPLALSVLGGLWGAALFCTYYYPFFILALWLGGRALQRSIQARAPRTGLQRPALVVLGLAALMSAWYWAPLLVDFLTVGFEPLQNRWFHPGHTKLPIVDFDNVFLLVGLVFIFSDSDGASTSVRQVVTGLLFASIAWVALGLLATSASQPVLVQKAYGVITTLATVAAACGVVHLVERVVPSHRAGLALAGVIVLLGMRTINRTSALADDEFFKSAMKAEFKRPPLADAQEALLGKVVLGADSAAIHSPAFTFIPSNPAYGHPSFRLSERVEFLAQLAQAGGGDFTCHMLRHNRFQPIDYVRLPKKLSIRVDGFPNGWRSRVIHFSGNVQKARCLTSGPDAVGDLKLVNDRPVPATLTPRQRDVYQRFAEQ